MNLVSLPPLLPDAIFDLRYAAANNVTGHILGEAKTIARLDMAAATNLQKAAAQFSEQHVRLVVWDAFRTSEVQMELRATDPDAKYVLEHSQHSLGLAVDITLANDDGSLLDMGTDHDDFSEKAHPDSRNVSAEQQSNRQFLIDVMSQHGFVVWPYEWWHFDYTGTPKH